MAEQRRTAKKRKRRDITRRMKLGDKIVLEATEDRRRVRVQVDEGVSVEHVRSGR